RVTCERDPHRGRSHIMRVVRNRITSNLCVAGEEGEEMAAGEFSTSGFSTETRARGIAKVFRDLTVYSDPEVLDALIPAIESRLADGWSQDRESERRMAGEGGGQSRYFLFVRRASTERPIALAMCA